MVAERQTAQSTGILRASESQIVESQNQPTGGAMGGRDVGAMFGQVFGNQQLQATAQGVGETAAGVTNATAGFAQGNGPLIGAVIFIVATIWIVRSVA